MKKYSTFSIIVGHNLWPFFVHFSKTIENVLYLKRNFRKQLFIKLKKKENLITTACDRQSPGNLTFDHNVRMEFLTDSVQLKDGIGYFTKIYSESEYFFIKSIKKFPLGQYNGWTASLSILSRQLWSKLTLKSPNNFGSHCNLNQNFRWFSIFKGRIFFLFFQITVPKFSFELQGLLDFVYWEYLKTLRYYYIQYIIYFFFNISDI